MNGRRACGVLLCLLGPFARADGAPTWAHDVAPIIMRRCAECHRPGEVAPFSLLAYADAAKRARFIAKTVRARNMPPWNPDGPEDAFVGDRHLSEAEIAVFEQWAASGAPPGDLATAPQPPAAPESGWRLGKPDLVLRMRKPFDVPPGPDDTYQVFPIPFSLDAVPADVVARARIPDSDVLALAAIEIHPGNRKVLHHADLFVDTTGAAVRRERESGGNGYTSFGTPGFVPDAYLGGRVPGMSPRLLPHGIALSVMPLKGDIALQVHYNATGKPETDQTEIGLYFMKEPTRRVMDALFLRSFSLDIPAGEARFVRTDSITVPVDCALMSVFAHMHFLGKEVHASVRFPDGSTRSLLDITRWRFRWHDRYFFHEPFLVPKGSVVSCQWIFDNSATNPANPASPPRDVRFGPNSTDEMCELQLGVIPVNLGDESALLDARVQKMKEKIGELTPEQRARFNWSDAFNDISGRE